MCSKKRVAEAVHGRRPATGGYQLGPDPSVFQDVWNQNVSNGFSMLALCLKRHSGGLIQGPLGHQVVTGDLDEREPEINSLASLLQEVILPLDQHALPLVRRLGEAAPPGLKVFPLAGLHLHLAEIQGLLQPRTEV